MNRKGQSGGTTEMNCSNRGASIGSGRVSTSRASLEESNWVFEPERGILEVVISKGYITAVRILTTAD